MHLNNRSKITSFALKTLTGAIASAVILSSQAYAAGLGKLTVMSGLGQPLNAEIELTSVSAEEAKGLVARLAPADAFRMANIEFNPALLSLRFAVEQRGSRQYVKITSSQPVNEPFVDMLLELSWSSGKLVREYTFLLDPAELRTAQSPQVAAPVDVLSQGNRTTPARTAPASRTAPAASNAPAPAPTGNAPARQRAAAAAPDQSGAEKYKVQKGDTLGKIAADLKPVDVSLDMMLVALYRANPDAFAGNNMNRLKSGQILNVPDNAAIKGTGAGEAKGTVIAHAADFNAYRNKLAGQVATAAPEKAQEATQSTGGKITAKVEERPTAANASQDKLKLSKATPVDASGKTVDAADSIAKEKALADATARVKELERNVSELEKLVVVKNRAAADAQRQPAVTPATPVTAPVAAAKPPAVGAPAQPAVVATPATPATPATAAATPATPATLATPVPTAATPVVDAPVAATPAVPPRASAVKPKPDAELKKNEDVAEAPGIVDWLIENILLVIGALVGLALLAAVAMGMKKRRARDASDSNEPSILGAPTDQAHSLFAETGGQSVDTSNSVFNSSFAPSASQLDTNEVDPVAEADVYIAYGRDAQAEEILKEALRTHPERYPVRLKLLEIYAARKDARAFEAQATDLYSMTKGSGDEWAQAAALGLSIDPVNPLYASAANAGPSTVIPVATAAAVAGAAAVSLGKKPDVIGDVPADLDMTANPAPVVVAPAAPVALAEDHTLDFDLGGLSFEPAKPAPTLGSTNDIADMDFSLPDTHTAAPVVAKADAPMDMDFNMDFGAPAKPPASESLAKAMEDIDTDVASNDFTAEYQNSGKDDLSGMGDLANAFNIPATPAAAPTPAAADQSLDFDSMNFDLPMSTPKAAPAFDMSSIDLDLPPSDSSNGNNTALPDFGDTLVQSPADLSAMHMEMETKLDLAIAYQEIGDKEGARELLDEVIKGGSDDQVGKANAMRAKLA